MNFIERCLDDFLNQPRRERKDVNDGTVPVFFIGGRYDNETKMISPEVLNEGGCECMTKAVPPAYGGDVYRYKYHGIPVVTKAPHPINKTHTVARVRYFAIHENYSMDDIITVLIQVYRSTPHHAIDPQSGIVAG